MKPYQIEFDTQRRVIRWTEFDKWGYKEAEQRSAEVIRLARTVDHPWSFIIGNQANGEFVDVYRAVSTIEMVFGRMMNEPYFAQVFGVVVSRVLFEVLSMRIIPVLFDVKCIANRDYIKVYNEVIVRIPATSVPSSGPRRSNHQEFAEP